MKKLSSYIWDFKFAYLFAILSMILSVSLDMFSPQLSKRIIDDVITGGQTELLLPCLLGLLAVGSGRCLFQYTKEYTFDVVSTHISADMRKTLFHHIQSLSADFFDKSNTGELMARIKDDIDRIWEGLSYVGMLIIEVVIHTSIVLFCMYSLSWKLALLPTVCMILAASIAIIMERKLGGIYGAISEQNAVLNAAAEENLAGVRTVKAFAREKFEIGKFLSHNKRYYELNMNQSNVFVKYYPYLALISRLLPMTVLLLGGYLVIRQDMTLGTLGAFIEYSMNIVWPMEMLGWLTNGLSSAFASHKKIKEIYKVKPSVTEAKHPISLESVKGKITFSHVSFHKEDHFEILHDISFTAEPGKTIGIMGATGSGKSSLVHLLQRHYDATSGNIYLDGINIKELPLKQLRSNISAVMQEVFLFSDTVVNNVILGKRGRVDFQAVKQASRHAQAENFVEKMENQYETIIGERGVGLSGGQKQRITIARAIARKAPILVLDDSTSALDMETEQLIQEALQELPCTTKLIIGHRISAVRNADEIIVLEKGAIAERGTHTSLMKQKGLYYETYAAQYGESGISQSNGKGGEIQCP